MAAQGYFDDPYLQAFVLKLTRRAPLIHRGYYVRAKVFEYMLEKFLSTNKGQKQILSLGAGFDSSYFRLYSKGLLTDTVLYEIDFPDLVKRKRALIEAHPEMMAMIGTLNADHSQRCPQIELSGSQYKLLGVDLTLTNTLDAALSLCGADFDQPTLLLSECVLTYMTRRCSSSVIKWAAETFCNSVFVLYEQINPDDSFGLFMQGHYNTMGSPLRCLNHFPILQSQVDRFYTQGWENVGAMDLNQFYLTVLTGEERERMEQLEPFDEYEELHLKCSHYFVLCGNNGDCPKLIQGWKDSNLDKAGAEPVYHKDCITLTTPNLSSSPLQRFGHVTCRLLPQDTAGLLPRDTTELLPQSVVNLGGFGEQGGKHMRVTELVITDLTTLESQIVNPNVDNKLVEVSRMHGTMSCLKDGRLLLIGGRMSPMKLCSQIIAIEITNQNCSQSDTTCNRDVNKESKHSNNDESRHLSAECSSNSNQVTKDFNNKCNYCNKSFGKKDTFQKEAFEERNLCNCDSQIPSVIQATSDESKGSNLSNDSAVSSETLDKLNLNDTENDDGQHSQLACGQCESLKVECTVIEGTSGEAPCPRWRHTAVQYQNNGVERILVFGGRNQSRLALGDCYMYTPEENLWTKIETSGDAPTARHSHTADMWQGHMVIAGGLLGDSTPSSSVHLLNVELMSWKKMDICIEARYSHSSHVIGDYLILIGGVSLSHWLPGVAMVYLPSCHSAEFSLPDMVKDSIVMLHRHTSTVLDDTTILILGGGGNCFSFGTHLNSSPVLLDISKAFEVMEGLQKH
ncbi:tRNA wybutosine-synthesizing protein 4-like isoform X2 [Mya arenaria]|nr:tRNA wybutosine-synthesizing protein 4-like isoform X2 [Mya arenaria]